MVRAYQREFHSPVVRSPWLMSGSTWENHDQVCGGSPRTMSLACVETKMLLVVFVLAHFWWRRCDTNKFVELVAFTVYSTCRCREDPPQEM